MSQQIIDIGANANDGTGEPLRNAFEAVNSNFTEIYTAGPVGSNVQIANNTITFAQQYLIMRGHGHKPDIFGNIKSGMNRKKRATAAETAAKKAPIKK